jgi:hypothetical protein
LELRELILLAIGLGVSGFVAYKTCQWVIYEEIGLGLASILLGFSILVFLAITNYDLVKRLDATGQTQVLAVKKDVNGAAANETPSTRPESEAQKEATETVNPDLKQVLLATTRSAEEAQETARVATQMAKEAKEQSERLGSIQAWATWDTLMAEFLEVENYLLRWEQRHGLSRDRTAARSMAELEERLASLGKSSDLPEPIRLLYLKRQKKYDLLSKLKAAVAPYAGQYVQMKFTLPPPPKLPSKRPSTH